MYVFGVSVGCRAHVHSIQKLSQSYYSHCCYCCYSLRYTNACLGLYSTVNVETTLRVHTDTGDTFSETFGSENKYLCVAVRGLPLQHSFVIC